MGKEYSHQELAPSFLRLQKRWLLLYMSVVSLMLLQLRVYSLTVSPRT